MQQKHPFRFGVEIFDAASRLEFIDKSKQIEDLGYSVLLVSDHFFSFGPFAALASAAEATSSLRVGSLVLGNDFYHPAVLAREAATLDLFTGGRLELGLGTGYYSPDYAQTGIPLASPGVRVSRLEESVQIIKNLLSGETVTFSGQHYSVQDLSVPKPFQNPHPPLLLGGGSKRILSLAARQADIISFNIRTTPEGGFDPASVTPEATQQKLEWVLQAARERTKELEFNILCPKAAVTNNAIHQAEAFINQWKEWGVEYTIEGVMASPHVLLGSAEQIAEKLERNREEYGFSYISIFEEDFVNFAPVVKLLSGK
jgi:probable F420-dependent oxidoreductase